MVLISRFTTVSSAGIAVLAAAMLATPARAMPDDHAECTAQQMDTARRMIRAECGTAVAGSATVYCAWYGAVEISDVQCG